MDNQNISNIGISKSPTEIRTRLQIRKSQINKKEIREINPNKLARNYQKKKMMTGDFREYQSPLFDLDIVGPQPEARVSSGM